MELKFRNLRADEIECRIATCSEKGVSLLLYKDARVDQNILDETVGTLNWQRHHTRDNANCIVSIWDSEKKQWIEKEDTGTESYTEKEKGLASDSFKRACFNFGIGRELYTAPFIWVGANDCKIINDRGKQKCYDKFKVSSITIEDGRITALTIYNQKVKRNVFTFGTEAVQEQPTPEPIITDPVIDETKIKVLKLKIASKGLKEASVTGYFKKEMKEFTTTEFTKAMALLDKYPDVQ